MDHIVWDQSFSIDVEEIDSQHKMWIKTINDLHNALSRSSSENLSEETEKAVKATKPFMTNSRWKLWRYIMKSKKASRYSVL
jgi:hemerythrin